MRRRVDALLRNGSARHVDRHLPRPRAPPAAPALAGREAAGRLPGARLATTSCAWSSAWCSSWNSTTARFPPRQIAWWINAQKDEGRRPQHIQPGGDCVAGHDAARVRGLPGALRPRRPGRLRRAAAARARTAARQPGAAGALPPALRRDPGRRVPGHQRDPVRASCACSPATRGHVFVVGDDDQAIYGWRGAKVENVQRFLRRFPRRARPCAWSRTTAPAPTSSTPPTR